jgi:hypothetical protein
MYAVVKEGRVRVGYVDNAWVNAVVKNMNVGK